MRFILPVIQGARLDELSRHYLTTRRRQTIRESALYLKKIVSYFFFFFSFFLSFFKIICFLSRCQLQKKKNGYLICSYLRTRLIVIVENDLYFTYLQSQIWHTAWGQLDPTLSPHCPNKLVIPVPRHCSCKKLFYRMSTWS